MQTNNYFRANSPQDPKLSTIVFFDDSDEDNTRAAYADAALLAGAMKGHVSIFRPAPHPGMWDDAQLIGHRRRIAMEAALEDARLPEDIEAAKLEIEAHDAAFMARRARHLKAVR